ncbi:MAG: ATP-binding cassette domain-containing protein [Myxococcales bacterium]|jgi:sodium transport system ATP-binding protein|nr:ATP-binding cassette domain-containing protein [Myxococcales bacterium]
MIEVENLQKRFGDVVAVAGVTFSARDGEIVGLLGPNGAGKTTTMRMLGTLVSPDGGHARIDGIDTARDPQRARQHLGVLPDLRGLYPRLTTREQIRYFGVLNGLTGEALEARIDHLIDKLDLKALADRRAQGFSQGERTKVAIARALVHDPKNVLLDEPTNGLDVMSTRAMRDIVRALREEGRCVIYTSHVMQEVAAVCDRIVIIVKGRVVAQGTPDDLSTQAGGFELEEAFVKIVEEASQPQPTGDLGM